MDRRRFLETSAVAAAGLALYPGTSFSAGGPKKRVVVLSAGLAGLAAAWELDQGLREGFSPGLSAEAGAMSFSDSYRHLLRYVRLFEVPCKSLATAAIRSASGTTLYHLRGSASWPGRTKVCAALRITARDGSPES